MSSSRFKALRSWPRVLALLGALLVPEVSRAAEPPPPSPPPPPPRYRLLRYEEDYRYLRTASGGDFWNSVKFIPLGEEHHVSVGGELRERFEYLRDPDTDLTERALLQRVLLHGDLHLASTFRLFVQTSSAS